MLRNHSNVGERKLKIAKLSINFSICHLQIPNTIGEEKQKQLYMFKSLEFAYMGEIILFSSSIFYKYVGKGAYSILTNSLVYCP